MSDTPAVKLTKAEAVQTVIREALKWANWCAGEGICAIEGEGITDPETFLMNYSLATDDEEWETLADRLPALLDALKEEGEGRCG